METTVRDGHTHCVELRVLDEQLGKVRMGLACTQPGCGFVADERWLPAPMRCLETMLRGEGNKVL